MANVLRQGDGSGKRRQCHGGSANRRERQRDRSDNLMAPSSRAEGLNFGIAYTLFDLAMGVGRLKSKLDGCGI